MSYTNLVLGGNWDGDWPEYVEVSHEGARDGVRYAPFRASLSGGDRDALLGIADEMERAASAADVGVEIEPGALWSWAGRIRGCLGIVE